MVLFPSLKVVSSRQSIARCNPLFVLLQCRAEHELKPQLTITSFLPLQVQVHRLGCACIESQLNLSVWVRKQREARCKQLRCHQAEELMTVVQNGIVNNAWWYRPRLLTESVLRACRERLYILRSCEWRTRAILDSNMDNTRRRCVGGCVRTTASHKNLNAVVGHTYIQRAGTAVE